MAPTGLRERQRAFLQQEAAQPLPRVDGARLPDQEEPWQPGKLALITLADIC